MVHVRYMSLCRVSHLKFATCLYFVQAKFSTCSQLSGGTKFEILCTLVAYLNCILCHHPGSLIRNVSTVYCFLSLITLSLYLVCQRLLNCSFTLCLSRDILMSLASNLSKSLKLMFKFIPPLFALIGCEQSLLVGPIALTPH